MRAKQEKILKIVITAVMVILGLICIYPFIFMLSSSFKPSGDVLSTPLQIIPSNFTMMNFETLFNNEFYDFFQWFGNTVVMTGLTLILKFFVITITAYGFAKMKFPGRDAIFLVLLAGLMIPSDIMIMPRYIIFKNLGILNTMWSLILPAAVDVYFVFLLRQAFVAVPEGPCEAARIDGLTEYGIWWHIMLPLSLPALSTLTIFTFVNTWNDFLGPLIYLTRTELKTIQIGLRMFISQYSAEYGLIMAASVVVLIPVLIVFLSLQKYFVQGVASSGIKG